jgi:hypothetical protein
MDDTPRTHTVEYQAILNAWALTVRRNNYRHDIHHARVWVPWTEGATEEERAMLLATAGFTVVSKWSNQATFFTAQVQITEGAEASWKLGHG